TQKQPRARPEPARTGQNRQGTSKEQASAPRNLVQAPRAAGKEGVEGREREVDAWPAFQAGTGWYRLNAQRCRPRSVAGFSISRRPAASDLPSDRRCARE